MSEDPFSTKQRQAIDEMAKTLGYISTHWAAIESFIENFFAYAVSPNYPFVAITAFQGIVAFQGRLNVADRAIKASLIPMNAYQGNKELRDEWVRLHRRCKSHASKRNLLAHGEIRVMMLPDEYPPEVEFECGVEDPEEFMSRKMLSQADIERMLVDIDRLRVDLRPSIMPSSTR